MRNCIFSKIGFGLKTNKERGKKGNCKRGTRVIQIVGICSTIIFLYLMGELRTSKWTLAVRITPLCF
jgi:hypothetical protein